MVAFILARVVLSGLPTVLLFLAAFWVTQSHADKLMDAPEFREQMGATISRRAMALSRVQLNPGGAQWLARASGEVL